MAHTKKKFVSQEYSASGQGKNLKEGTKGGRTATFVSASFFAFSVIAGVSLVAFSIVFFFSEVHGPSMMSVLNANYCTVGSTDSVIVNRQKKPTRGDIVIIKPYAHLNTRHIKRVIAVGGERVYFQENRVETTDEIGRITRTDSFTIVINDEPINEIERYDLDPYLAQNIFAVWKQFTVGGPFNNTIHDDYLSTINEIKNTPQAGYGKAPWFVQRNQEFDRNEMVIPDNYIFYMGDNRGGSGTGSMFDENSDYYLMSKSDGMWIGPQPLYKVLGIVVEIMPHHSAPRWFWNKFVLIISFQWHKL